MGTEIERKYLVKGTEWKSLASGKRYCQGYIATVGRQTVRVRIAGEQGFLTIKGASAGSVSYTHLTLPTIYSV